MRRAIVRVCGLAGAVRAVHAQAERDLDERVARGASGVHADLGRGRGRVERAADPPPLRREELAEHELLRRAFDAREARLARRREQRALRVVVPAFGIDRAPR